MIRPILFWFVLLLLAFVNAAIRELTYGPFVGKLAASQISVFTAMLLFTPAIYFFQRKFPFASQHNALRVGLLWALMTELFEFLMVCVVAGNSLVRFLDMHNVFRGEFWPVILIFLAAAPSVIHQISLRK